MGEAPGLCSLRARHPNPEGPPEGSPEGSPPPPLLAHLGFPPSPSPLTGAPLRRVLALRAPAALGASAPFLGPPGLSRVTFLTPPAWRGRVSCQVCVVAPQRCQRRPGPAPGRPRVRVPPWRVPLLSSLPLLASPWGGARGSSPPPPGPARLPCTLVWILPILAWGLGVRAELCRHPDVRCVPCGGLPGLSTCDAESGIAVVTAAPQMRDA